MEAREGQEARLAVGERHELVITDVAFGGEGVGRIGEIVVFVYFVIPGEKVLIEITETKKNFARGNLIRVIDSSADRAEPKCPYFGVCGGCQYQHISYGRQLQIKHKQISDLFQRIGKFDQALIGPVVPCPREYGYRNRLMIRSQWNKLKQGLEIGFIRYDNRWVVDVEQCPIAEEELNDQIRQVRADPPPKGGLKVVLRKKPQDWEVPRDSFFQNNFFLLPELVRTARVAFQESGNRFLIDVYCGVGFFGIELANLAERVVGVESDKNAILSARRNALARGLTNTEFQIGQAEQLLPGILQQFHAGNTTVLLDPPRTGVPKESLEFLKKIAPRQIIYVSCHPATLARDLSLLCEGGVYALHRVTPLDMFPQTQHVECVADLRLSVRAE